MVERRGVKGLARGERSGAPWNSSLLAGTNPRDIYQQVGERFHTMC